MKKPLVELNSKVDVDAKAFSGNSLFSVKGNQFNLILTKSEETALNQIPSSFKQLRLFIRSKLYMKLGPTIGDTRLLNIDNELFDTSKVIKSIANECSTVENPIAESHDSIAPIIDLTIEHSNSNQYVSMFSKLIAAYYDGDLQGIIHPSFKNIITQLSPVDAINLLSFKKYPNQLTATYYADNTLTEDLLYSFSNQPIQFQVFYPFSPDGNYKYEDIDINKTSIINLNRLGLVNLNHSADSPHGNNPHIAAYFNDPTFLEINNIKNISDLSYASQEDVLVLPHITLTTFGANFLEVCCKNLLIDYLK